MDTNLTNKISKVAFIGNYLPRQCGIATFTTDLCEAVNQEFDQLECVALAMNDTPEGYNYPARVRFQIQQDDLNSYRDAAEFLNLNHFNMVCLQHEFGIYGGAAGGYIFTLLRELQIPVVTTLHTILKEPNDDQMRVMQELAQLSDRLVVMSQRAVDFLTDIYGIDEEKIDFIPHGIPDVPFIDPNFYKDKFNVEGKQVILTFGLMSPNKGLENVIKALPEIVEKHPNVVYIVLGATHPHVKKTEGERYRNSLQQLAQDLGVTENVVFYDQFVEQEELIEFIGAADIYITPYLNQAQITSGTLAYTVGSGKAVISTPYWHAQELLADGRGVLVPFADPQAIAEKTNELLDNEADRHAMRKRAYMLGREMVWPEVSRMYMESFEKALEGRMLAPRIAYWPNTNGEDPLQLLHISLKHMDDLTDNVGMLQHSIFDLPDYREGYTTDD
ncbi:MAG TPA: glycosyltransferase family 4 protein, partial [Anaerolineaceae bacterium]|nr:glycosyltransferase family 4 protein [Anaerolineaceae bacterium]